MPNPKFENAVQEFLALPLSYLSDYSPSCHIYWVNPNEPEHDHDFPLPLQEVEHYTRSFINQGFFVAVRAISKNEEKQIQIVLWEEWDGSFKQVHWPTLNESVLEEWIWRGFDHDSDD